MHTTVSRWLAGRFHRIKHADASKNQGFTLLELLIALIVGSVVISGLLFLVTEMLKIERRETAIDDTQRDIRRALQYIASDVEEALYVYVPITTGPGAGDWPVAIQSVQTMFTDIDNVVLAFWRPNFVDQAQLPPASNCAYGTPQAQLTAIQTACQDLRQRRAYYSLIAYEVVDNGNNNPNGVWRGQARIIRHELPRYTDTQTLTPGFQNDGPIASTSSTADLDSWAPGGPITPNIPAVLVDFIAHPTDVAANDPNQGNGDCIDPTGQLVRVPFDVTVSRSFYTCLRTQTLAGGLNQRDNQNLEIFLQGDAALLPEQQSALGTGVVRNTSLLPALRTSVFVRGVVGDVP